MNFQVREGGGVSASHHFRLSAAADPGLLPRILEPFAKRGLVPRAVHATQADAPGGARLAVEVAIDGLTETVAAHIAACLSGTVGVEAVALGAPAVLSSRPGRSATRLGRFEDRGAEQHVDGMAIAG
ncbi:MAG: hypothetical protein HKM95_08765 [Inquilinus sp.]|nr:hypothetical protein [Inquilinus sp.]